MSELRDKVTTNRPSPPYPATAGRQGGMRPVAVDTRIEAEARFEGLYRTLNEEQKKAVDVIEGPVMVLAGPGTGKTQVLAMRIAKILKETDMDPWNILCLTFTESAVAAMRTRLLSIIGEAAYQVRIHTFHSFCNDIIQEHAELFSQGPGWQVVSDVERLTLLRTLIDELSGTSVLKPYGSPYLFIRDIQQAIGWLKKEGVNEVRLAALVKQSDRYLRETREAMKEFLGIAASKRTDNDCASIVEALHVIGKKMEAEAVTTDLVAGAYERYMADSEIANGKRAASKARTTFKNELKKRFERMEKQVPRQKELVSVYRGYQKKLRQMGRYDYDDMIIQVLEKFRTHDALLAEYQEQFQYILVDEYQDTNGGQNEVVRLLGTSPFNADQGEPNIFVVGDDKQSIFRFQGASLENLLSFYKQYEVHVTVISLRNNYRSQQTVLDAAGGVIANNEASLQALVSGVNDELVAVGGTPQVVALREHETELEEVYAVARQIERLIAEGTSPAEIAVLYRYNRDAELLLDVFLRLEIPVRIAGGENVLVDRQVHQLLQLLRYISFEQRDELLVDILEYDFLGLSPLDTLKLIYYAGSQRKGLLTVLSSEDALAAAEVSDAAPFLALVGKLATWRAVATNDTAQATFDVVLKESGLLDAVLSEDERLAVLNRITTVFDELRRFNHGDPRAHIRDFLLQLSLLEEHGQSLMAEPWQTKSQAVNLMTAHKSKGLEFEHVFMVGLVDKKWGNVRDLTRLRLPAGIIRHDPVDGQQNNEDERRLFYVGLTRAKQEVHLSYAREGLDGRARVGSTFLRELPADTYRVFEADSAEDEVLERMTELRVRRPNKRVAIDVREWLAERLEHYAMSVTHLNNYLECPRLFYYRNVLLVPGAKTKHMAFGTAVHAGLCDLYRQVADGAVPNATYLVKQFQRHLKDEILSTVDYEDSLAFGEEVLRAYYAVTRDRLERQTLLEHDFKRLGAVLGDLRGQDGSRLRPLPLTGKLDKVEMVDEAARTVNVVDYKTGNPDNATKYLKEGEKYWRQLVFYKLLGDEAPRFDYEVVSAELDFVQMSNRTGKHVSSQLQVTDEAVVKLRSEIEYVWGEIQNLAFLDAEGCGECEYCDGEVG